MSLNEGGSENGVFDKTIALVNEEKRNFFGNNKVLKIYEEAILTEEGDRIITTARIRKYPHPEARDKQRAKKEVADELEALTRLNKLGNKHVPNLFRNGDEVETQFIHGKELMNVPVQNAATLLRLAHLCTEAYYSVYEDGYFSLEIDLHDILITTFPTGIPNNAVLVDLGKSHKRNRFSQKEQLETLSERICIMFSSLLILQGDLDREQILSGQFPNEEYLNNLFPKATNNEIEVLKLIIDVANSKRNLPADKLLNILKYSYKIQDVAAIEEPRKEKVITNLDNLFK